MATTNLMLESLETVTGAKCRLLWISENLSRFPSEDMKLSQLKNYKFWGEASMLYEFPYYNIAMLQVWFIEKKLAKFGSIISLSNGIKLSLYYFVSWTYLPNIGKHDK